MTIPEDRHTHTTLDAAKWERYRAEHDGADYDDWRREHSIRSKHEDEDYVARLEEEPTWPPCNCGDWECEECA